MSRVSDHHCHARGCAARVPPHLLMCRKHWRMVPRHLQQKVWAHYRPGQETDKRPAPAYLEAAREACVAVYAKERGGAKGKAADDGSVQRTLFTRNPSQ